MTADVIVMLLIPKICIFRIDYTSELRFLFPTVPWISLLGCLVNVCNYLHLSSFKKLLFIYFWFRLNHHISQNTWWSLRLLFPCLLQSNSHHVQVILLLKCMSNPFIPFSPVPQLLLRIPPSAAQWPSNWFSCLSIPLL